MKGILKRRGERGEKVFRKEEGGRDLHSLSLCLSVRATQPLFPASSSSSSSYGGCRKFGTLSLPPFSFPREEEEGGGRGGRSPGEKRKRRERPGTDSIKKGPRVKVRRSDIIHLRDSIAALLGLYMTR